MTKGLASTGGPSRSRSGSRFVLLRLRLRASGRLRYIERSGGTRLAMPVRARLASSYRLRAYPGWRGDRASRDDRSRRSGRACQGVVEEQSRHAVAMQGDIEQARALVRGGRQAYFDAGALMTAGGMSMGDAEVERRAGDDARAEEVLREGLELARADRRPRLLPHGRPAASAVSLRTEALRRGRATVCGGTGDDRRRRSH